MWTQDNITCSSQSSWAKLSGPGPPLVVKFMQSPSWTIWGYRCGLRSSISCEGFGQPFLNSRQLLLYSCGNFVRYHMTNLLHLHELVLWRITYCNHCNLQLTILWWLRPPVKTCRANHSLMHWSNSRDWTKHTTRNWLAIGLCQTEETSKRTLIGGYMWLYVVINPV